MASSTLTTNETRPTEATSVGPILTETRALTLGDLQWRAMLGNEAAQEIDFNLLAFSFPYSSTTAIKAGTLELGSTTALQNKLLVFMNSFSVVAYQSLKVYVRPGPARANASIIVTVVFYPSTLTAPTTEAELYGFPSAMWTFSPMAQTEPLGGMFEADLARFNALIKPDPIAGGKVSIAVMVECAQFGTTAPTATTVAAKVLLGGRFKMGHVSMQPGSAALF